MAIEIYNKTLTRYEDEGAETFIVPDGIEIIGEYAFTGAENLKTVILPEGVVKIEQYAFQKSAKIKKNFSLSLIFKQRMSGFKIKFVFLQHIKDI